MTKRPDLDFEHARLDSASLERAIAATRRHFHGRAEHSALTEERILEQAWRAPRRFRPLLYLPLAAVFVGAIAFAQELGTLFAGASARFLGVVEQHEPADSAPRQQLRKSTRAAPPPLAQAPSLGASPSPSLSVLPPPSAARVSAQAPRPRLVATPASAGPADPGLADPGLADPGPAEVAVDEFALYREAHQAHFVEHNYALALTRWDRYLAAARHGSLVPEARYNRALALYHLGRREEASAALRPFADGIYGRYRRDEASRLLESLAAPAR